MEKQTNEEIIYLYNGNNNVYLIIQTISMLVNYGWQLITWPHEGRNNCIILWMTWSVIISEWGG